jgi:hypothetical protein
MQNKIVQGMTIPEIMQNKIVQGTTIPEIMQNLPYIPVPPNFSSLELFIHACLDDLFTTYSLAYFYELRNLAFTDEENFATH